MFPRSEIFLFLEQQEQQLMSASTKEHGRASADYIWSVKKKRGTSVIYTSFENNAFHDQHKDWWTKLSGLLLKCKVKKQENRAFSEHVFASIWDLSNDKQIAIGKIVKLPRYVVDKLCQGTTEQAKNWMWTLMV